jgi:hypothetical protein
VARRRLLANILAAIRTIDEPYGRAIGLGLLVDLMVSRSSRERVVREAFKALALIPEARQKSRTISTLAAFIGPDHGPHLLCVALKLEDEFDRADALKDIALAVLPDAIARILAEARRFKRPEYRAIVISAALQRRPWSRSLRRELIEAISGASDGEIVVPLLAGLSRGFSKAEAALLLVSWGNILDLAGGKNRRELYAALATIAPIIAKVCGEDGTRDVVDAMFDVRRWWP